MFDSIDPEEGKSNDQQNKESVGETFAYIAAWMIFFFVMVSAFLLTSDTLYGTPICTYIVFTVMVWGHTFLRSRIGPAYNMSNEAVQQQLARIGSIHIVVSVVLFAIQTCVLHAWSRFPDYWKADTGKKGMPPLVIALFVLFAVAWLTEVLIFRGILERACTAKANADDSA
jgi:hypothetical protein